MTKVARNGKNRTLQKDLPDGQATVYIIEFSGITPEGKRFVKIGHTAQHPFNRLRDLQTGCPYELRLLHRITVPVSVAAEFENFLHSKLDQYRIQTSGGASEWFALTDRTLDLIIEKWPEGIVTEHWI